MVNLGNHFSRVGGRNSEHARQHKWFIKARQDHQKREEMSDKLEDNATALAVEVILATEKQIYEFKIELDKYNTATVAALMETQKQLDAVNTEIEEMLNRAYVMEDGRRVFKTEDGAEVYDEYDKFVGRDELDYDLISPDYPTANSYKNLTQKREGLEIKKQESLEFQRKVDEAEELAESGTATSSDIDRLKAELRESIPDDVKAQMSGYGQSDFTKETTVTTKVQPTMPDIQTSTSTPSSSPAVSTPAPI